MAIIDGHIRCSGCKYMHPLAAFPPSVAKKGHGECSACCTRRSASRRRDPAARINDNAKWRRWYQANRVKHLARTADYYRRNSVRAQDGHLERTYGISGAEYAALLSSQGGGCAICKKTQSARRGHRLAVDHDHASGCVRGLLCSTCNRALGVFGDTIEGVRCALNYLERAQQTPPLVAVPAIRINLLQGAN